MDELGLFDSESTAFLDDLTDGNVIAGGGLNQQGMQQQYVQQQPQAQQQQYQVMGGAKIQQQQQQQFFDHDYGGGGGASMGAGGSVQGMQGNMTSMAAGNPQAMQQNLMSPNHVAQFGSPPPGSAAQNQQGNFTQYNMQQQGQQQQQQQMWNQNQNAQGNSFQQQQQPNQFIQQQQMGQQYVDGQQQQGFGSPQPQRHVIQQQQQYSTSQAMMQRPAQFTGQMQAGQQMNGQVHQQNFTYDQQQMNSQQQLNVQQQMNPQQRQIVPQQQQQMVGQQQQQHYPQQQQQQFQQQHNQSQQQVYAVASNVGGTVTMSVANQQNGNSVVMTPQTANAKIQQLQSQIQQLYNMPQTPDTQQQMLDLQEQLRTLRAQQQHIQLRQQQQQQTFVIRSSTPQQTIQQQQRPLAGIVIPRNQLRNIQPGQTVQIQRAGHPPQTVRIQATRPTQHVTRMPQPQQIRQQISPGQPVQAQQVIQIQQQQVAPQQQHHIVMQQQQQQQPAVSVGQIIRVQKPGEGGVVQVQTLGATTQLAGGQQVQQVRLVQVSQQQQVQQQGGPRLQIVQSTQQQQPGQQKVITVLVQKPGSQKSPTGSVGSNSISPGQKAATPNSTGQHAPQEIKVSMEIPSTVATTEEIETSEPVKEPAKPKRKRPTKKRSAEQEKADKIIQEAIAKAKAEGREVPKVIETEDGTQIHIPQPKKKASPKKKKADAEKDKKKAKEPKEPKPKPPPKPRPPKKKKTLPTFLKNKKRSKKADSDDELKITPPTSPLLDDAFKRRSARNTKRKKYLDELDLDISEEEQDENTPLVEVNQAAHAEQAVEFSIVEKIMAVRMGKRPKEKDPVEQVEEVVPTKVEKVEPETEENMDVDIEGDLDVKKPAEECELLPDPLMTGNYVDPNEILAQAAAAKSTAKPSAASSSENLKVDVTSPTTGAVKFLSPTKTKEEEEEMIDVEEFYVKYKNFSYLHCEWRTADELEVGDKRAAQKIKRFRTKPPNNAFDTMDDEYFNPDYVEVDRVLASSVTADPTTDEEVTHYLVKWRGLPYEDSTWELETDVDKAKIEAYLKWCELPPEEEREYVTRPRASEWKAYKETPVYKNDNTLREYQLEGINWLLFCWYNKQNCILADEMGLGKTIQSITFLQEVWNAGVKGPYLVIVPLSTIGNWAREFELWTDMNVIVYHGTQPSRNMLQQYEMYYRDEKGHVIPGVFRFDALVTTYEVIIQDVELLSEIDWRVCIIDEAHRLKNQKCKLSEGLKVFDLEHRVLLTGTPLQNNVEELFALLHFLEPKQFNSSEAFMADFGDLKSQDQVDKLKELLKPMMLRRLKEDVEKTLAPKEETIVEVELTNQQKRYYRAILERNFAFLTKASTGVPSLMNTMMELRKCCNHPFLLNGAEEQIMLESGSKQEDGSVNHLKAFQAMVQASGKLVLIDKLLPKLKAGNHKVLIFSQMIRVLDIIEDYLLHKQYLYERIDGRIRGNLRQEAIDRFSKKDSDRFVFLLCTRAGGLGINLTAADTVIIYDSDWNPQNDLQAQARCHRIGQSKAVKIYRLITRNSYEREMFDKASRKLGLDKAVLQSMGADKTSNPNQMSKKEVEELLKKGAYGALMDDGEGDQFCEEDIDQILQRRTQVIKVEGGEKGSTFAKASFTASSNGANIDIDDPNFWDKWAKDADMDVSSMGKNELIMELPRQRKQTARYTYNDDDNEGMSELDSSDADSDSDAGGSRRGGKKGTGRRPGRRRRDEDDDGPIDGPFDYYTRADCFKVEKNLLVYGWGRWEDILKHGKHRRKLTTSDVKLVTRALLFYALQQYAGDERIKSFMYDLIAPHEDGEDEERTYRNHSGLSAPVPRGRKGKKMVRGPGPSAQDEEMASKMDIDADALLVDEGYKKHLKRHANKVLLRVRLLYYLRHEVIGEHAEKVMSGRPAHEIPIPTPSADADPPAYWWNIECDRSLLVGIFKHGFEKYNLMRNDPCLVFLQRCGPPDQALVNAEMNDEEIKNPSDDEGDTDFKPKKRGRPGRKKAGASALDDDDEASVGGTPTKGTAQKQPVEQAEEGKHPWPTVSDLNTRLRRIITSYQRSRKHQQLRMDQLAKKNEKRQKFEQILQERERVRVESRQRWVRREESEFYRVVSSFGVERDRQTGQLVWDTFRRLANLDKKYPETLTAYFNAFYHMCMMVCRRFNSEHEAALPNDIIVEPISEERANRCLSRIDLLTKIRGTILWHPKLEERLKLCQPSVDMPDWWQPGLHDKELLIGAAKHGLGRTDFHIAYDSKLCFKEIIDKKQAALIAATTADAQANSEDGKPVIPDTKPQVKTEAVEVKAESSTSAQPTEVKAEVKEEIKEEVKMEVKEEGEIVELNGEEKDMKSAEERTDVDTEEESMSGKPSSQSQDTEENMSMEIGELSQSSAAGGGTPAAHIPTSATSVYWPKDRVIMNRLEQVCHAIEQGEWPAPKRYRLLPECDSRSSTPAATPGTPDIYMALDSSVSGQTVSPATMLPFSFAGTSGDAMLRMVGEGSKNMEDGLKLKLTKKKRGRRSRAEIEAQRNLHLRELMASQGMLGMSDAESESNLSGYGLENGVSMDSPLRGDESCSSMEPGEFNFKRKAGRKRKMDRFSELFQQSGAERDGSPARKRWAAHPLLAVDPESRVTVISIEEGTRLAGEDAPKRKDLEVWLAKHPGFVVEGVEDVDTEDGEDDCVILPPPSSSMSRPGPSRRRPRLDPSKITVADITGEENVAVINRETGKKITGAKAPPLKHLVQWLDKNPAFDVDAKWAHIVHAKGKIPDDMHDRILVPHRRRSAIPASAAASSAAASAASDYYTQLAQSASNADPNVAAQYQKYLAQCASGGITAGAAAFSALAAVNPAYASLFQYHAALASQQQTPPTKKDSKTDGKESSSKSESTRKKEEEAAEALSSMTSSLPYLNYNPLMAYAAAQAAQVQNSQYAAMLNVLMQQQNGAQTPPKSSATSGEEPSPSPAAKKQRVRDNSIAPKIRTPSSTITSASASSKHDDVMDLTVKKSPVIFSPSVKIATGTTGKSQKAKKGFTLENIVQDLSSKKVKSQTSTESDEETS